LLLLLIGLSACASLIARSVVPACATIISGLISNDATTYGVDIDDNAMGISRAPIPYHQFYLIGFAWNKVICL
jgi:hypothetical protein